ncbi:hypothetical protein KEM09_21695 [Carboxylicivirga mesophila]|uniref:Uncharacterized protein n=1 Tax=Carboxylicivirga mesophila TaxID=1166478 RepID=A0ABS5KG38_9BACT|nr:hypothetical protein [Carboxylicivirga mesophila]MBS2214035.1 hypothetical protein [Carboxylicivirga mesophila]
MKNIILFTIWFFFNSNVFCTNIIDIFYKIPSEYLLNKNIEQRKDLVLNYNSEAKEKGKVEVVSYPPDRLIRIIDKSNGFMEMYDGWDGTIQICYWNIGKEEKIVAINHVVCATFDTTVRLTFFKLTASDALIKLETESIVPYNEIFRVLLKEEISAKEMNDIEEAGIKSEDNVILSLPRFGRDIYVSLGYSEINNRDAYIARDNCTLFWEDFKLKVKF